MYQNLNSLNKMTLAIKGVSLWFASQILNIDHKKYRPPNNQNV